MDTSEDPHFMIEATANEVQEILKAELSAEQLSQIALSNPDDGEEDVYGKRRIVGAEDAIAATCLAIAGNASYELLKVVGILLVTKLGKEKVLKLKNEDSSKN